MLLTVASEAGGWIVTPKGKKFLVWFMTAQNQAALPEYRIARTKESGEARRVSTQDQLCETAGALKGLSASAASFHLNVAKDRF
jgi:hypothetical protein